MKTTNLSKIQQKVKKKQTKVEVGNREQWKYYLGLTIILIITYIIYTPSLHYGLLAWDDNAYLKENPLMTHIDVKEIFSQFVLGNYHPITVLAFAIEYHFFGLKGSGYHTVNLLLHLLNVILVFYTIFLLSNKKEIALVAALLFGIHPLHVESVAWVAELKDLLYTFFFLTAYIFYIKYMDTPKKRYYVFALVLFLLSLLSKAMAASLPVVLLLTDYFKAKKINTKIILEKIPFFLLAIILGVVAVMAQKSSDAIQDIAIFTFPQRVAFACYGFITYLYKWLLPFELSAFYPYPAKIGESIPWMYYGFIVLLLGLTALIIYSLKKTKKILFGLGFFAATIFLVLQLLPVGSTIMADRYSYIPSIGICYLAGLGLFYLWNKKLKWLAIISLSVFSMFFCVKTYNRCGVWQNDLALWNDVIRQYQNISLAYYNRACELKLENRRDEAMEDFNKAILLKPTYYTAYNNRGLILMDNKNNDDAIKDFNKALELEPKFVMAYHNRGVALFNKGKYEEAIRDFSQTIKLKPDNAMSYYCRGMATYYLGKNDAACLDLKQASNLGYPTPVETMSSVCK